MKRLGAETNQAGRLYFTGGASAVLLGWRANTLDIDVKLEPDQDRLLRALPRLKEDLEINVELAAPDQFIPPLPGWPERSRFISQHGPLSFYHYDFHAQALAKIQRGHAMDLTDVRAMLERGLISGTELRQRFAEIEPQLYRYPAIDPEAFRRALDAALSALPPDDPSKTKEGKNPSATND